jgi:hypothetical protein
METNNDIKYRHKYAKTPSEKHRKDVRDFFQGSSVTKQVSAFSIAQISQDIVRALIR